MTDMLLISFVTSKRSINVLVEHWHSFKLSNVLNIALDNKDLTSRNWGREKAKFVYYNLHRQNTRGMKAPIATKIGSMEELSSSVYGFATLGPLGFLRADVDSL